MADSYRPSNYDSRAPGAPLRTPALDSYRPIDRYDAPNMYQFNGSQPPMNGLGVNPQNNFSFQMNNAAPQYPQGPQHFLPPTRPTQDGRPSKRFKHAEATRHGRDDRRNQNERFQRAPARAAERPLLHYQRGATPEQMPGMNDGQTTARRFLDADDLSDSEEEAMEVSDTEEIGLQHEDTVADGETLNAGGVDRNVAQGNQTSQVNEDGQKQEKATPKWSNPEIFTALPPPDLGQRKKKDVLKLIRKARIVSQAEGKSSSQVAANDDFISFNFDDDDMEGDGEYSRSRAHNGQGQGVPGAPNGPATRRIAVPIGPKERSNGLPAPSAPRSFSHLQQLNSHDANIPPATGITSSDANRAGPSSRRVIAQPNPNNANSTISTIGQKKRKFDEAEVTTRQGRPPPPKRKKGASDGKVLSEWLCDPGDNPVPWVALAYNFGEHAGFRLHKEICDFYEFVKPQEYEQVARELLLTRLQTAIKEEVPGCELRCFGSFAAGLYLPNADMDLVIVSHHFLRGGMPEVFQNINQMKKLAAHLTTSGIAEAGSTEVIGAAKVPIIKFIDRITGIRVDISFENSTGLVANQTFLQWKEQFPAMPILVILIKQFLLMRGLNEVVNGGLGGFSITCLVTSLLQNMPRVQNGDLIPEQHLGEILLEFLDFYGNQLDITRTGISMEPPGYFPKQHNPGKNPEKLAIMDPNSPGNDISGGSHNVMLILRLFSEARDAILRTMRSNDSSPSLLKSMLGGDYSCYSEQRNQLMRIYQDNYGPGRTNYTNGTSSGSLVETTDAVYTVSTTQQLAKVKLSEDVFAAPNLPSEVFAQQNKHITQVHVKKKWSKGPRLGKKKKAKLQAERLQRLAKAGNSSTVAGASAGNTLLVDGPQAGQGLSAGRAVRRQAAAQAGSSNVTQIAIQAIVNSPTRKRKQKKRGLTNSDPITLG